MKDGVYEDDWPACDGSLPFVEAETGVFGNVMKAKFTQVSTGVTEEEAEAAAKATDIVIPAVLGVSLANASVATAIEVEIQGEDDSITIPPLGDDDGCNGCGDGSGNVLNNGDQDDGALSVMTTLTTLAISYAALAM